MLKAVIFDLDDILLWDAKSVDEALKITCEYAGAQCSLDPRALETYIVEKAPSIYASFATIDHAKNIGIGVFEALWGDFQGEGEQEAKMRQMAPEYRLKTWNNGLRALDVRSEEHTSELQSRGHLVCRLLLEKKKIFIIILYLGAWVIVQRNA